MPERETCECKCVVNTAWVWNRRIIEQIRAEIPNAPVLDVDLVEAIKRLVAEHTREEANGK